MLFWRSLRRFFSATTSSSERIVPADEVRSFVVRCMGAVGTKASHAESLAELLVTADERGHYSHGLNRLGTGEVNASPLRPNEFSILEKKCMFMTSSAKLRQLTPSPSLLTKPLQLHL